MFLVVRDDVKSWAIFRNETWDNIGAVEIYGTEDTATGPREATFLSTHRNFCIFHLVVTLAACGD
jgi:hypothetical protein